MLNPSPVEILITVLISLALAAMGWKALLNVARSARRGADREPGVALVFTLLALAVLFAPGYIAWNSAPPLWTWPFWFFSAWGLLLTGLERCWNDAFMPWIKFPAPPQE